MFGNPIDFISVIFVLAISYWRFNSIPAPPAEIDDGPGLGAKILKRLWLEKRGTPEVCPPSRANTTLFKYRLYQFAYAVMALLVYLAFLKIPPLMAQFQDVINWIMPSAQFTIPQEAGSFVVAFLVAVILPSVPPFSLWDASFRYMLYERAAIPAQQLRERTRLLRAPYCPNAEDLTNIKKNLVSEGFDPADIEYDQENNSTCSLWVKASLLMESIDLWQEKDKFKTAFAILKECDGRTLSVSAVKEQFDALRGDAKAYFEAKKRAPSEPETAARDANFRHACKQLLQQICDLFSRVSLHAHYSDRERVRDMNQLGFGIRLDMSGPIPGHNDLLWLSMILGLLFVLPLSKYVGPGSAIVIGFIVFSTVLTPLVLASRYPQWAATDDNGLPAITLQVLSAAIAMLLGLTISVGYRSILNSDLYLGWEQYSKYSYPWTLLSGMFALLLAWRIQVGSYPDSTKLHGLARYQLWGNWVDAAIFSVGTVMLMSFVVLPLLNVTVTTDGYFRRLFLPTIASFIIGFVVPTWYRAQMRRKINDRRGSSPETRAEFQLQMTKTSGIGRGQNPA